MHASARIAGGCSASFVSKNGLVLTNHHCVAECAQQLSDDKHDYMTNLYFAHGAANERQCPAMEINRLETISDVTDASEKGDRRQERRRINTKAQKCGLRAQLTSTCVGNDGAKVRCDIVDLYHGGQYKLYRYHRFQDVRLVLAPEESAAAFGGDPDNFNFPRYDFDMSLVRVYEDGKPAEVKDYLSLAYGWPRLPERPYSSPGTRVRLRAN